jgi:hypothetical protein
VTLWTLETGDRVWLRLAWGKGDICVCDVEEARRALERTREYWRSWLLRSETGRTLELGPYQDMMDRSALVLKLLSYGPTGAIAAAATTSLPEEVGGIRNWDYRYTWVRDTSFTLQALFNLGHLSETEGYLRWVERLISEHGVEKMQIMYGLRGETDLPEEELHHLDGYKGSRPVRIGNEASTQSQMDIYGELMDAALKLSDYVGKIDEKLWPFLRDIAGHCAAHWREPDSGIWEVRGGPYHFVYSKVMCWVALDRGMTIARRYGFPADIEHWEAMRAGIKEEVLERGWNPQKGAFRQHYDSDAVDASNLLLPILGFLPFDDHRVLANVEATVRELGDEGLLYRYTADDALEGDEGTFLLCSFWLAENLIAQDRLEEAGGLIRKLEATANHLGLFSEEYDVRWQEALGNFPQAFTHIGYVNSVVNLRRALADRREEGAGAGAGVPHINLSLADRLILNEGTPGRNVPPGEIAGRLKEQMNVLRGAFFDTPRGRVAYERMRRSEAYEEYLELSRELGVMDLGVLRDRAEQLAFWINLYNVIVIHGVVEMGIRDSVKEVRNFFRRVMYRIGPFTFSPEEIEHGILRANRRPPASLFRVFRSDDPRLGHRVRPLEPRIHYALVCASSSCPPIGVYTAEGLEEELDVSARTFLNSGGISIDRDKGRVSLSRIFKWYGGDFGRDVADRLRSVAPYLYRDEDREYLLENADRLRVSYQDYDWRLNRTEGT